LNELCKLKMANIDIETEQQIRESWIDNDIRNCPIRRSWEDIFNKIFNMPVIKSNIEKFIENEKDKIILPSKYKIFNCFNACSFKKIKVVIIGQDPYHSKFNEAQGFSFLVPKEFVEITVDSNSKAPSKFIAPPSLKNINKEVMSDTGKHCGNLEGWVNQGVLLMNASLTVEKNNAGSHMKYWGDLTNELIREISTRNEGIVFMLWGRFAQSKEEYINKTKNHSILRATHPSPLAGGIGWFGCRHFSQANALLLQKGKTVIEW